jgi:hypothetical protein
VHAAVAESNRALSLDVQIKATAEDQARLEQNLARLRETQAALSTWRARLAALDPEQALSPGDRSALYLAAEPVKDLANATDGLLGYPLPDAPVKEYTAWLDRLQERLRPVVQTAEARQDELEQTYLRLTQEYAQASQNGMGLSAELLVQKLSRTRVYLDPVRPLGLMMLVGAGLGLLAWAAWMLFSLSRRSRANV